MKSAEAWATECPHDPDLLPTPTPEYIRAIQADALRHAAAIAQDLNDGHDWPITRKLTAEANRIENGE